MATITNILCTTNKEIDIQSQGGALNIATQATATVLTLGNITGASAVNINTGTGGHVVTTTNGVFTAITGSGVINIGQSGTTGAINIGNSSAGALSLASSAASTVTIANANLTMNAGTGTINVGSDASASAVNLATGGAAKALTIGSTNTTSAVTINTGSGGITIPSFASYGVLVSTNAGLISDAAAGTAGFVLTSNGSSSLPTFQASDGGILWSNVTGATQAMAVQHGYVDNGSGTPTVYTLPATATVGQMIAIQGSGTGLWQVAQNAGQTIHFNAVNSTTGVTGSITSTSTYDSITLICNTANTDWAVYQAVGNLSVV